jgi:hypothetical protein
MRRVPACLPLASPVVTCIPNTAWHGIVTPASNSLHAKPSWPASYIYTACHVIVCVPTGHGRSAPSAGRPGMPVQARSCTTRSNGSRQETHLHQHGQRLAVRVPARQPLGRDVARSLRARFQVATPLLVLHQGVDPQRPQVQDLGQGLPADAGGRRAEHQACMHACRARGEAACPASRPVSESGGPPRARGHVSGEHMSV